MSVLATLTARREAIEAERREIHEAAGEEPLTDDQQARWAELDTESDDLDARIGEEQEKEARAQRVAESRAKWGSLHIAPASAPVEPRDVSRMGRVEARDAAMRVLDDSTATRHLASDQKDRVDAIMRTQTHNLDGSAIARRLLLTETDAYRSGWTKAVTQATPAFTSEEARALDEFRAMSIGTDTSGGFGVPVLIDPSIILTSQGSLNPFRRISRVETITNDEWKGVSSAGVSWSYDAEAAAVSDDTPTLAQPTVTTAMARGFIPFSIEVGGDYPSFAEQMAVLLAEGYDELQAQAFATGSVSTNFRGILTALDANTNVEVVTTTDGVFQGLDVNKVWKALPDRYKNNATWVMSHEVGADLATFGNSNNLSFVTVDLTGVVEKVRNRPIEFSSYFPGSLATTGAANILVVGDFRNYVIAERAGMTVELVPHLVDVTNNRPTGQRGWFAWGRHGGNSVNDLGFRLLQNQ